MNIAEISYGNRQKSYFKFKNLNLKKDLEVVVDTDKGFQYGRVISIIEDRNQFSKIKLNDVVRIANKNDILNYKDNIKLAQNAVEKCKKLAEKNHLSMTIIDGIYNLDKSQLIFRFVADERVDFRELAKELGAFFHTRIELRQIGIRDKAKEVGGFGPCGRRLCCSTFLTSFDSITINMAKNQNVSLNPTKINGVCGRLLCCLKYENDTYTEFKKKFPKVGSKIEIDGLKGKVESISIAKKTYSVVFEDKSRLEVEIDES